MGTVIPWFLWALLGIALAILEMVTQGFVLLCFAFGAVAAAITDLVGYHDLRVQLGVFAAVSFVCFFTLRPALRVWFSPRRGETNVRALIGTEGTVITGADPGQIAYVRLGAEVWRAQAVDGAALVAGERVRVVRVEGNRAIVEAT